MDFLTFEETRERVDQFLTLMQEFNESEYILTEIVIPEFRNYYTPNIPIEDSDDTNVYIKNKIFQIEVDHDAFPDNYKVLVSQQTQDGLQHIEIISMREFLYVFANPEGFDVLEKIQFMINNEDWDSVKEKLHPRSDYSMANFDDDIPF